MLIGRENEIKIFKHSLSSRKSDMILVYGRRRVGKTFMIKKVLDRKIDFEMTGIQKGYLKDQLKNFAQKLSEYAYDGLEIKPPKNWMEAFQMVKNYLSKKKKKKKVIFLDELPWMASHRSKFIPMLGHFWNDWAVHNNVLLVVCGSAASWMIDNVLNNKGSLHNRITEYISLQPFTLYETELYLKHKKIKANRYQILQLYMVCGGIPFYLDLMKPDQSIAQNIDRLCFSPNGFLVDEFERVFHSLFDKADNHISIIKALATKWTGISREEIVKSSGLSNGGGLTRILAELEKSAFIQSYQPYNKKKKTTLYRLIDNYSLFNLQFVEKHKLSKQKNTFLQIFNTPKYNVWTGYSFENICLIHHYQLSKALGISQIQHSFSSYRYRGDDSTRGMQIDLLIDRADGIINLCEMKFSSTKYKLNSTDRNKWNERANNFTKVTKTHKTIFTILVTTYGLYNPKEQTDTVQNIVTIDDLFEK